MWLLDVIATSLDKHAKAHMLDGDESVAEILRQFLSRLPWLPIPVTPEQRRRLCELDRKAVDKT
jgi:hypothetical protein